MGIPWDDLVLIQPAKASGEPAVVTVNCPDKAGLGCDLCRIVLEFGLTISRGDFSTDGRWCYVVLWVVPNGRPDILDWKSLKTRLLSVCPSCLGSFDFTKPLNDSSKYSVYLLKFCSHDRKGLLHDVTEVLTELEFMIQRVKVMTTPDGKVMDWFFITDGMGLLHTKQRRDDTCEHLNTVFGEHCISCEIQSLGPEYESLQGFSALPPSVAEELFSSHLADKEASSKEPGTHARTLKTVGIVVDNLLSPAHTLLQIKCADQKGIYYDIMRTSKDLNIQIAYARFCSTVKGYRNIDLFIQQTDGKKILDFGKQTALITHLKEEMVHPLRVSITNRGPDTELLVANPVELSGKGRPRVFYDVTSTLKKLRICIFSAEVGRHATADRQWEVYRFLFNESAELQLSSSKARARIVERVKKTLMGW